jgi:hypothetical protein
MKTVFGLLTAALLLGICTELSTEERKMVFAATTTEPENTIPPMDRKAPARTETATFALG